MTGTKMNKYDEKYEIRLAQFSDIDDIMTFIDNDWKKGHILAKNRKFFEYEFLEADGTVNFIIAIDREKRTIEGISGFLKASHNLDKLDIWGSIWKVKSNNMVFLGTELIARRQTLIGCRYDLGIGNNPVTALPLFQKKFNRIPFKLNHYYRLGVSNDYVIAVIKNQNDIKISQKDDANIIEFKDSSSLWSRFSLKLFLQNVPLKDEWYIEHRYFNHPIYKYSVYGIEYNGDVKAIFITRRQDYKTHYAIRIVEFIGEQSAFAKTGEFWHYILSDSNCEYVDFYCHGIKDIFLKKAGFECVKENDDNIIPNYFSPYVCRNIDIWAQSACEDSIFVKGDGDQDRPN